MTSKTPGERLEPCPLCGGEAYRIESNNGSSMLYVGCAPCGLALKAALVPLGPPGVHGWSRDIVAAWNRRPTAPASGLGEEETRDVLRYCADILPLARAFVEGAQDSATYRLSRANEQGVEMLLAGLVKAEREALAALSPPPRDGNESIVQPGTQAINCRGD